MRPRISSRHLHEDESRLLYGKYELNHLLNETAYLIANPLRTSQKWNNRDLFENTPDQKYFLAPSSKCTCSDWVLWLMPSTLELKQDHNFTLTRTNQPRGAYRSTETKLSPHDLKNYLQLRLKRLLSQFQQWNCEIFLPTAIITKQRSLHLLTPLQRFNHTPSSPTR